MANNIGLDFGTTYSVVSHLKNIKRDSSGEITDYELEAFSNAASKSPYQDSIVVRDDKGNLLFGADARGKAGWKNYNTYKGFKMLLPEDAQGAFVKEHGYTDEDTPYNITLAYLNNMLKNYCNGMGVSSIDKLVIGAPAIWLEEKTTIEGKSILKEIISKLPKVNVKEIKVVREPDAACAYFIENYRKKKNKKYQGNIFVVDYGGGTLDIALCDVTANGEYSSIKPIESWGAGENSDEFVGKAGLAFLELVTKILFRKKGMTDEEIVGHRKFNKWMHEVENVLINKTAEIDETFSCFTDSERRDWIETDDDSMVVGEFEYAEDEIMSVTYAALYQAYDELIFPALEAKLKEATTFMDKNGIDYSAKNGERFKIALVGGFCNFSLVQEQVKNAFDFVRSGDRRFEDIINDRRECEKAISYGAALIANNVIECKQVSPYYLGIAKGDDNEMEGEPYYAIRKGDEVLDDNPVFVKDKNGVEWIFGGRSIPLIAWDTGSGKPEYGRPIAKYRDALKLNGDKAEMAKTAFRIGFSLDQSLNITIHKQEFDRDSIGEVYDKLSKGESLDGLIVKEEKVKLDRVYDLVGGFIRYRR